MAQVRGRGWYQLRVAESVTFGGGGLDRAAHLRADPSAVARLSGRDDARTILVWHGRVLIVGSNGAKLARLKISHKIFRGMVNQIVFLGLQGDAPIFAHDISDWQPVHQPEAGPGIADTTEITHPDLTPDHRFVDLRQVMALLDPLDAELAASAKAVFGWHEIHRFCARCGQATDIVQAGWQRKCPACSANHFPRTDPVVIMLITKGNKVLLGRSPHWPERMFSLLAGFVEPGETLESAVRREVAEEAGIAVGDVHYLASQPWPFPASLMVGCQGEAKNEDITIDPAEIEKALWITREELMDVFAGRNADILPARRGSIAQFLLENWLADRLE